MTTMTPIIATMLACQMLQASWIMRIFHMRTVRLRKLGGVNDGKLNEATRPGKSPS